VAKGSVKKTEMMGAVISKTTNPTALSSAVVQEYLIGMPAFAHGRHARIV
jgi:hypothetical protein